MNVIYSCWNADRRRLKNQFKLGALSAFLSQKRGFNTTLYTSRENFQDFYKIKFDDIKIFKQDLLNSLPKSVWSACKILAVADQKEPFLHFDLDLLVYNRNYELNSEINNKKFIFYHYEDVNVSIAKKVIKYFFDNTDYSLGFDPDLIENVYPRNFAMFGSYDQLQVSHIAKAAKKMIIYLKKHKDFYESKELLNYIIQNKYGHKDTIPVILEQVIFFLLMTKNLKNEEIGSFCDILNNFRGRQDFRKYMHHIHGEKDLYIDNIDEILQSYGIKY
jgi:hypothetical protein